MPPPLVVPVLLILLLLLLLLLPLATQAAAVAASPAHPQHHPVATTVAVPVATSQARVSGDKMHAVAFPLRESRRGKGEGEGGRGKRAAGWKRRRAIIAIGTLGSGSPAPSPPNVRPLFPLLALPLPWPGEYILPAASGGASGPRRPRAPPPKMVSGEPPNGPPTLDVRLCSCCMCYRLLAPFSARSIAGRCLRSSTNPSFTRRRSRTPRARSRGRTPQVRSSMPPAMSASPCLFLTAGTAALSSLSLAVEGAVVGWWQDWRQTRQT